MKPKEGDRIRITDEVELETWGNPEGGWSVIAVFDHYDFDQPGGNWDPFGELAMAQGDIDDEKGKKGDWYVIVEHEDDPGMTMSLASYECEVC